jgi:hypothetical protein
MSFDPGQAADRDGFVITSMQKRTCLPLLKGELPKVI